MSKKVGQATQGGLQNNYYLICKTYMNEENVVLEKASDTTFKEIVQPTPTVTETSLDDLLRDETNLDAALTAIRAKITAVRALGVKSTEEVENENNNGGGE